MHGVFLRILFEFFHHDLVGIEPIMVAIHERVGQNIRDLFFRVFQGFGFVGPLIELEEFPGFDDDAFGEVFAGVELLPIPFFDKGADGFDGFFFHASYYRPYFKTKKTEIASFYKRATGIK